MNDRWQGLPKDLRPRILSFLPPDPYAVSGNYEVEWPMLERDVFRSVSPEMTRRLADLYHVIIRLRAPSTDENGAIQFSRSDELDFALNHVTRRLNLVTLVVPDYEPTSPVAAMNAFLGMYPRLIEHTSSVAMLCMRGIEVRSALGLTVRWRDAYDVRWESIEDLQRTDWFKREHPVGLSDNAIDFRVLCPVYGADGGINEAIDDDANGFDREMSSKIPIDERVLDESRPYAVLATRQITNIWPVSHSDDRVKQSIIRARALLYFQRAGAAYEAGDPVHNFIIERRT